MPADGVNAGVRMRASDDALRRGVWLEAAERRTPDRSATTSHSLMSSTSDTESVGDGAVGPSPRLAKTADAASDMLMARVLCVYAHVLHRSKMAGESLRLYGWTVCMRVQRMRVCHPPILRTLQNRGLQHVCIRTVVRQRCTQQCAYTLLCDDRVHNSVHTHVLCAHLPRPPHMIPPAHFPARYPRMRTSNCKHMAMSWRNNDIMRTARLHATSWKPAGGIRMMT